MSDKPQKHTITNTDTGPRGIHTTSGLVMLEAGETREVELAPGELNDDAGYFSTSKAAAKAADKAAKEEAAGDGGA